MGKRVNDELVLEADAHLADVRVQPVQLGHELVARQLHQRLLRVVDGVQVLLPVRGATLNPLLRAYSWWITSIANACVSR